VSTHRGSGPTLLAKGQGAASWARRPLGLTAGVAVAPVEPEGAGRTEDADQFTGDEPKPIDPDVYAPFSPSCCSWPMSTAKMWSPLVAN
jgi:hypothetical protein